MSYWCHHCDYDLILANINIYSPCLIINLVYITSPQQPNDGRPHHFANYKQKRLLLLLALWLSAWSWTSVRSHFGLHLGGVLAFTCAPSCPCISSSDLSVSRNLNLDLTQAVPFKLVCSCRSLVKREWAVWRISCLLSSKGGHKHSNSLESVYVNPRLRIRRHGCANPLWPASAGSVQLGRREFQCWQSSKTIHEVCLVLSRIAAAAGRAVQSHIAGSAIAEFQHCPCSPDNTFWWTDKATRTTIIIIKIITMLCDVALG